MGRSWNRHSRIDLHSDFEAVMAAGHNRFVVEWNAKCTGCGGIINKGNVAGYNDDEIVCEDCFVCEREYCGEC